MSGDLPVPRSIYPRAFLEGPFSESSTPAEHFVTATDVYEHLATSWDGRYDPTLQAEAAAVAEFRGTQCGISLFDADVWHANSLKSLMIAEEIYCVDTTLARAEILMLHSRSRALRAIKAPLGEERKHRLVDMAITAADEAIDDITRSLGTRRYYHRFLADTLLYRSVVESMKPAGNNVERAYKLAWYAMRAAAQLPPSANTDPKHIHHMSNPRKASLGASYLAASRVPAEFSRKIYEKRELMARLLVG